MVIQRWQSVLLFIAALLMGLFCFMPFGNITTAEAATNLHAADFPVYLTLNALTSLLLLIDIFLYKNLKQQSAVTLIAALLEVGSIVAGALLLFGPAAPTGEAVMVWDGGFLLIAIALVLTIWARRLIAKDRKTLSSYDRIR